MAAVNIAKGFFVGGHQALEELNQLGITHVLTVVNYEVEAPPEPVCHWRVDLEDKECANLLEHVPLAVRWVEIALRQRGARVLVHCHAGTSRSAAIAAAVIMKAKRLSASDALAMLRSRHPAAAPNAGFIAQLEAYEAMGWEVDEAHPVYKAFLLDRVALQWEEEGWVDPSGFGEVTEDEAELAQLVRWRCRKCRHVVATTHNVVPASSAAGMRRFRGQLRKRDSNAGAGAAGAADVSETGGVSAAQASEGSSDAAAEASSGMAGLTLESSLFLEPMKWMEAAVVGPVAGKLYCPGGCGTRLGSFNWAGISNSGGAWVTPGFQLHTGKLDMVDPHPPAALASIRYPAALAPCAAAASTHAMAHNSGAAGEPTVPVQEGAAVQSADFLGELEPGGTSEVGVGEAALPEQSMAVADAGMAGSSEAPAAVSAREHGWPPSTAWFHYLVLDCDGVLVDTERASCEALRRAILEVTGLDIPQCFPDDYTDVFGMDIVSCLRHYQHRFQREDWGPELGTLAAEVKPVKERHYAELTAGGIYAFPEAAPLIRSAQALGMRVGVGSSGEPEKIARNLGLSGLAPLLDPGLTVSAAHVGRGKPAPDVYVEVLRRLGCSGAQGAARALVVEDSVHGLVAARGAGAFAVGVTNSLPFEALAPHADLVVQTLEELDLAKLMPTPTIDGVTMNRPMSCVTAR